MTYPSPNRQPLLFVGVVLAVLAFSIGYAAGAGGWNGVPGMPRLPGQSAVSEDGIDVFFSPKGGCTEAVVEEIDKAQRVIEVQAYSFTSRPIAEALISAHHRGAKVTVVLDKSELKQHSEIDDIARDGIPTFVDSQHAIAHNKIILIDGQTIITGSFNFTNQAENSNAENLLLLHGRPQLYSAYHANFQHHLGHSEAYDESTAREPTLQRKFR